MVSSLNRRSKKNTDVQATARRIAGRTMAGAPPPRSRMRTPLSSTRGFHPPQPVASASISPGWPICRASNWVSPSRLLSSFGKTTNRTASSTRQKATMATSSRTRIARAVVCNQEGYAARNFEGARTEGIITGYTLVRKGTVAALGSSMDLAEALEFSRYASRLRAAQPELFAAVTAALDSPFVVGTDDEAALQRAPDSATLALLLRKLRQRVFLGTLLRDLTGRADLLEVCSVLTRLADVAASVTGTAHHRWVAETHGNPIGAESGAAQKLIVVGMGKLGGGELNASSDIDLVFVYPEAGTSDGGKPLANQEFFERLGRRVIATLDEATADGFVFRVDMRLRPYGDPGPLCSSFVALETYLITQGRTWERYAWLKARPLTGDQGDALLRLS